jgi:hypothetical protein
MSEKGKTGIFAAVQVGHSILDYCFQDPKHRSIKREIKKVGLNTI